MPDETDPREFSIWLDEHLSAPDRKSAVVELGCGLGADARYMSDLGYQVFATDRSVARVCEAARRAPEARFVVSDLRSGLPFIEETADLVVASLSLHYFDFQTTRSILRDISRVLRPHGMMLCRVNVAGETFARWGEGIEHEPDFYEVEPGLFKRFFTEESLDEMLSASFAVDLIRMEHTLMSGGDSKRTLMARARRR